jgi:uncharacterized membrane protein SirB2
MSWRWVLVIHVLSVATSITLFVIRGIWMMADSPRLCQAWVRVVPHVVDTVLLTSAIGLVVLTAQYPLQQNWLTAKIIGLLAYIGLGTVALRFGRNKRQRVTAWGLAVLVFAYIVAVAVTRNPLPLVG